jgi:hypothetical protein
MNDDAATKVVEDSSSSSNNGNSQQNTEDISVTGKINEALSFNGTSDFITTVADADFDFAGINFTECLWESFDALTADRQCLLSSSVDDDNRFEFYYDSVSFDNPALVFIITVDGTVTQIYVWEWTPTASTDYHLAVVKNDENIYCYVNAEKLTAIVDTVNVLVPYGEGVYGEGIYGYGDIG